MFRHVCKIFAENANRAPCSQNLVLEEVTSSPCTGYITRYIYGLDDHLVFESTMVVSSTSVFLALIFLIPGQIQHVASQTTLYVSRVVSYTSQWSADRYVKSYLSPY